MLSYESIQSFLYQEARALDERRWDDWLAFYSPDVEYHMPAWDDDGELTSDPQKEVSLIYYPSRAGLEDRVFRIETERAASAIPDTRTGHALNNIEVLKQDDTSLEVRFNWTTQAYRYNIVDTYFGYSVYTIDTSGAKPVITRKYVVLKNDRIHHWLDVYHI